MRPCCARSSLLEMNQKGCLVTFLIRILYNRFNHPPRSHGVHIHSPQRSQRRGHARVRQSWDDAGLCAIPWRRTTGEGDRKFSKRIQFPSSQLNFERQSNVSLPIAYEIPWQVSWEDDESGDNLYHG